MTGAAFGVIILSPLLGAAVVWALRLLRPALCGAAACVSTALTLAAVLLAGGGLFCAGGALSLPGVLGLGLHFRCSGLQLLLCALAAFLWLMTTLFAQEYLAHGHCKPRYYFYLLLTEFGILGVFLSADLYTTLAFFEVMSLASWVLVVQEEEPEALRAGDSYLAFAILGGLCTLMGLFLLYDMGGTLLFDQLHEALLPYAGSPALYAAGVFVLIGFAAKCAMFPLHTWLPTAHPVAPAPASALLSGIITKAGMFGIFVLAGRVFLHDAGWGMFMLLFGTVTMVLGAVLGVFSINLKRTLACSSMSQIGFILVGVGMMGIMGEEGGMPVWGLILHMMNHSLFKLCLFVCAGVVVMNLHKLNLNDIRGFGRGKPLLMFGFGMGTLGITGIPLWNGYVSKTLLHEAIVEHYEELAHLGEPHTLFLVVEALFLFSGGLTVCYMTKLFVCLFVERNQSAAVQAAFDAKNGRYMNQLSSAVVALCGGILPLLGLTAHQSMERVAAAAGEFFGTHGPHHTVHYLSWVNLKGAVISLAVGAAVYLLFVRGCTLRKGRYLDLWPAWLNLEERVYRPLLLRVLPGVGAALARLANACYRPLAFRLVPALAGGLARLLDNFYKPLCFRLIPALCGGLARLLDSFYKPLCFRFIPALCAGAARLLDNFYKPLCFRFIPFVCAFAARLLGDVFEWFARFCRWLLRLGSTHRLFTPTNERFTVYEREPEGAMGFAHTLAFGLLVFGAALVGVMVWLLAHV